MGRKTQTEVYGCIMTLHNIRDKSEGFTLIELSLVLVIIGLLVGGVIIGQSLIEAAEVRKEITQLTQLASGINTFKNKYNCVSGDCPNETDFFGSSFTSMATCTGNGDGDGYINHWPAMGGLACESNQALQVLLLAKLIPPKAISVSDTALFMWGPKRSLGYLYYTDLYSATTQKGISLSWFNFSGGVGDAPALSPNDTRMFDEKIDDGLPATGRFLGLDAGTLTDSTIIASCREVGLNDYQKSTTLGCRTIYFISE